jgi:hypothetical protein
MTKKPLARAATRAAGLVGIAASVALAFVPAAIESSANDRLDASVVATNDGPLPACSASGCTAANTVWYFVYVKNKNRLTNSLGGTDRDTVPNAFVISSVDQDLFIDGVATFSITFTPPPDAFFPSGSGHWPSTVRCSPRGGPPPCSAVGSPAVVPGEKTAVLYAGWQHDVGEVNGKYVFRFTVHGTLNGTRVDVTASSRPISMTD